MCRIIKINPFDPPEGSDIMCALPNMPLCPAMLPPLVISDMLSRDNNGTDHHKHTDCNSCILTVACRLRCIRFFLFMTTFCAVLLRSYDVPTHPPKVETAHCSLQSQFVCANSSNEYLLFRRRNMQLQKLYDPFTTEPCPHLLGY